VIFVQHSEGMLFLLYVISLMKLHASNCNILISIECFLEKKYIAQYMKGNLNI